MLTVFTGAWGESHDPREVRLLRDQVGDNLTHDHQFVCVSDKLIDGIGCVPPGDLPGWWNKLNVLKSRGPAVWLDLDVVITGSLDFLLDYAGCTLAAPKNWAMSGHGGVQSSVMVWADPLPQVREWFDPSWAHWPPRTDRHWDNGQVMWGDQEALTFLRDTGRLDVTPINPSLIKSFKYHCRDSVPENCRVVVFHGTPKPREAMQTCGWIGGFR